jgi:hypothetical protein
LLVVRPLLEHGRVAPLLIRRGGEYLLLALAILILLCVAVDTAPAGDEPADATEPDRAVLEPRDIETMWGTVARVRLLPRAGGGPRHVTLLLRTDIGDEIPVAIAPRGVVKNMKLRLRAGDGVEIVGWRIVRGKPAALAAEITTRGRLFVFRDRYGNPVWAEP